MEKLDAKPRPIGALLAREFFFRVPEYQRPFSWDSDHFEDLVDDLTSARRDQEYFLGTIVLHHREKEGYFDVVDGQQRLTSVMILLACLRDLVADQKFKTGIQDKILQQQNVVDGIPERVRLEVRDRQLFADMVVTINGTQPDHNADILPEPERRYINARSIFRSRLSQLGQTELQQIITFLNQKCVVISLATPAFEDAFRLFTIVNDRGKQLRRIDILKALNLAPDVIVKETVRNRIAQEWEDFEKELGESTFENVFHLVRLLLLKDKPQGDLLKEFEDRVIAKNMIAKGEPFFDLMFEYARLYTSIFLDRDMVPEASPLHTRYRALIHIMNAEFSASEWRACLLLFAEKFQGDKFYEFCLLVEKVYLAQWVKGVRKDERYGDYSKILLLTESAKKADEVLAGITFDEQAIKDATQVKDLYSIGYGKYFLLRLELVSTEHDAVREFNARSVEHVLPQQPDLKGYWADHHDLGKIKDYVNMIGNLVLLSKSKNSSASNFDFAKKKEKYLRDRVSDYPRSIKVLEYKDWNKEDIDKRTADAKDLIVTNP